jgi:hypothetical protein
MAFVGALRTCGAPVPLTWVLGSLQTAAKAARPAHPFSSGTQRHRHAAFSVNEPWQQWPHRGLSGLSRIAK